MGYTAVDYRPGDKPLDILRRASSLYVGSTWTNSDGTVARVDELAVNADGCIYGLLHLENPARGISGHTALVIKTQRWTENGKRLFAWKEMTESMGPAYYGMSRRMFAKLAPLDKLGFSPQCQEWAQAWRTGVREQHEKLATLKALAKKLTPKAILEFAEEVSFGTFKTTRFAVADKPGLFYALDPATDQVQFLCRLRKHTLLERQWSLAS